MCKKLNKKPLELKKIKKLKTKGKHVENLQIFLKAYGYLYEPNPEVVHETELMRDCDLPECEIGVFDEPTKIALENYQRFYGLKITGELNAETIEMLTQPRCGNPDKPSIFNIKLSKEFKAAPSAFVLLGSSWAKSNVTYRINNFTTDLGQGIITNIIRDAFLTWSNQCSLTFTEVRGNADIEISFQVGAHGDGFPFDNGGTATSNTLAHAFAPPTNNSGNIAGDLHFDDFETWTNNNPPTGIDLLTVAIHEIGHSLGLDHTPVTTAVMFANYGGINTNLDQDDINGVVNLYGNFSSKSILSDTSIANPSFMEFNNQAVIAWTGSDSARRINLMFSDDLRVWFGKRTLNDTSLSAPSITVFNGRLYLAWRGKGNNRINVMSSSNGRNWRNKVTLNDTTYFTPTISSYNGKLVVAWTGTDNRRRLNILHSTDGRNWGEKKILNDTSIGAPSICNIGNDLLLSWTGTDSRRRLNVMRYNGRGWLNKVTLNERSITGPDISNVSGTIFLSWTGTDSSRRLNLLRSSNGRFFFGKRTFNETSYYAPSIERYNNSPLLCWTGKDNSRSLNTLPI